MPLAPFLVAIRTRFVWLLISMLLAACSGDLSRSKAKSILEKEIPYPNTHVGTLYIGNYSMSKLYNLDGGITTTKFVEDEGLKSEGYVSFSSYRRGMNVYDFWRVELTDKGRQYVVDGNTAASCSGNSSCLTPIKMRLADVKIGSITGITGGKHPFVGREYREVEYIEVFENVTPFGKAAGLSNGTTRQARKDFLLYDNGWRLAR